MLRYVTLTALAASILVSADAALAQSSSQIRACRDYVLSRREFRDVPASAVRLSDRGDNDDDRRVFIDWRIRQRGDAEGYCVVDRRGRVSEFRITQNNSSNSDSDLENNYGERIRPPYRARITSDDTTLVNRPDKGDKRDVAEVDRNERVTVYRRYYERESRITWLLVQGERGQRGWINSSRVSGGSGGGENIDDDFGNSGNIETNWGRRVRAYRARITSGNTTLVNRPNKDDKNDVANVSSNETITVYREYYERESRITWFLVRGERGQGGWINSERVGGRGGFGNPR